MTRTLVLPLRVVSEANVREHWGAKAKRATAQRSAIAWAWLAEDMPRNRKPDKVLLTRIAPRPLDSDNLQRSLKACRDQVAHECNFNDADPACHWLYGQERGEPKQYGIRIECVFADCAEGAA